MKRTRPFGLLVLVPLLLFPTATAAGPAAGDSAVGSGWRLNDGVPRVWFELDARSDTSGADARGTYTFNFPDLGVWFTGEVTCLRADGPDAVVGGRITDSQGLNGEQGFAVWLIDGGLPAGGQPGPDLISTTSVLTEDLTSCPSLDLPSTESWKAVRGSLAVRDR